MLLGFFLVENKIKFIKFELYLLELYNYISNKSSFFDFLDQINYELGIHPFEDVNIEIINLNEKTALGWITPKIKSLDEVMRERMIEIGTNIENSDKMTIHRVLQASSPSDLLF